MRDKVLTYIAITTMVTAVIMNAMNVYAGTPIWITDVLVSNANIEKQQAESHIIASVSNNNNLVVALMDNSQDPDPNDSTYIYRCRAYNSTDGGNTWTDRGFLPLPSGTSISNDPVVASTSDGKFFIACFAGTLTRATHVIYWVSTDNGATWSGPNTIRNVSGDSTLGVDKPWIAADVNDTASRYRDNVYACWTEIKYPGTSFEEYSIKFRKIWPSTSTIKTLASPSNPSWVGWCNIAVGKSGIIYVTWMRGLYNSTTGTYTYNVMMKRSFDGGETWSAAQSIATFNKVTSIIGENRVPLKISNSPHIAVDNDGNLHLVYVTKTSAGDTEVMYRKITNCTSSSQLCTLSSVVNLSNNSKDQWEPAITVSKKSNTVHVTALDRRDDSSNIYWNTYHYHCHLGTSTCTSSSDWSINKVSDYPSVNLPNVNPTNFIGHYHGITTSYIVDSSAKEAYTTFTDTRYYGGVLYRNYNIFSDRTTIS
jgi:hypothetical protein